MSGRVHYIDWLRVLAVLLLFPFHTGRVYNLGEDFYVKGPTLSAGVSAFIGFVDVWHMPLLFMLAGMSTYFALSKRSGGQYAGERFKRLLVPFLFGFLILIPPQTWLGGRFNSAYVQSFVEYLTSGDFLVWNIRDGGDYYGGFGIGHLWFILLLLLISLAVLPLLLWGRKPKGTERLRRTAKRLSSPVWWLLVAIVIVLAEALPDPTQLGFFYYITFFILGFIVMFDESFTDAAERWRWPSLAVGSALTVLWLVTTDWRDALPDPSWTRFGAMILGMLSVWVMVVALLGLGKRYLDSPSRTLAYLSEASYPVYILHQTVIVVLAFGIVTLVAPWWAQWLLLLAASVGATFLLYEIVRRVGILRFLFGMRPARRLETAPVPSPEKAV